MLTAEERRLFLAQLSNEDRIRLDRYLFERSWRHWLEGLYPRVFYDPAPFHEQLWEWAWAIDWDRPRPFVGIWFRAAAKSTNAELIAVALGAREVRKYALYICATQEQADDHVANIATLLDHSTLARIYPNMALPMLNRFGNPKGWRRNRIRTASGFTIDALGLDTAARGAKVDDDRPDLVILDDVDSELDGLNATERKLQSITRKLLPAMADNGVVLAVQNLVIADGVFGHLAGTAAQPEQFLTDRIVSGPIDALLDPVYEEVDGRETVTAGTPTWNGFPLRRCQQFIKDSGITSFRIECQHEVHFNPSGMWANIIFKHVTPITLPVLFRTTVWVDPAVTSTNKSDSMGIQCSGIGDDGRVYALSSWEGITSPLDALKRAILLAVDWKSPTVGVETDQGGETWQIVFEKAVEQLRDEGYMIPDLQFVEQKAGAGHGPKVHRAAQLLASYEQDMVRHLVGTHDLLERALKRFPTRRPYDLVDANYWAWYDLIGGESFQAAVGGVQSPLASYRQF